MKKSIYTREYATLLKVLRAAREQAGITQIGLAEKLERTQTFVSKVERGDRRLDAVELRWFCLAIGISFVKFVEHFEAELRRGE